MSSLIPAKIFPFLGTFLSANLAASAITGAISGIANGLKEITTESREFRKIMGSLEVSSENAGYSAEQTTAAYNQLYGVLADNQTAATTTANLQALGLEQEQLNQLINGTIGAWATYGDSIPIDGLAEAINETAKVGTVTGTFADVLNWAGTSEDEFNERLAECSSQSERANLILQEMSRQGLMGRRGRVAGKQQIPGGGQPGRCGLRGHNGGNGGDRRAGPYSIAAGI